jgi:hypothetical protein
VVGVPLNWLNNTDKLGRLVSVELDVAVILAAVPVVFWFHVVGVPVRPLKGTLVAAMEPVPVVPSEAPEPTSIVAVVLVLLVKAENAVADVLVALMVTAPVPPEGVMVTLLPAIICVTLPALLMQPTLVIRPLVVVHSGLELAPMEDNSGVVLKFQEPLTVCGLVNKAAATPAASNADVG